MKPLAQVREALLGAGAREIVPESIGYDASDASGCCFEIGGMRCLASWGGGWDHLSVSAGWGPRGATRVPTYAELEAARRMFFADHEIVVQIHPPLRQYVNCHPFVLHLWRSQSVDYPLPPQHFIA